MRIKLTEDEVKEAIEFYIMRKLSLDYQPTNLHYYFCDDKDDVLNLDYLEILLP